MGNGWQKPGGKGLSGESGTLFAAGNRNSDRMGDFLCWRIPTHCLLIVPELRKEGGFLFAGESRVIFCRGCQKPRKEGGFLFAGESRVIFCLGYQKPTQEGGFLFGGDSRAIVCCR
jgi:hypothetical protein